MKFYRLALIVSTRYFIEFFISCIFAPPIDPDTSKNLPPNLLLHDVTLSYFETFLILPDITFFLLQFYMGYILEFLIFLVEFHLLEMVSEMVFDRLYHSSYLQGLVV